MTHDIPTGDRIEQMLEVEQELAEQYDDHRTHVEQSDPDPDTPDDDEPDIPTHAGIVERFTRKERAVGPDELLLGVLTNGGRDHFSVPWPSDPTDESEELVRLCEYLNVPIDRLADIQGKTIPLCQDVRGDWTIHIPPIQTTGNALRYRVNRFLRRKEVLIWTDAVERARREYVEEQVSESPPPLKMRRRHEAQKNAQHRINADSIDEEYPSTINPAAVVGGVATLVVAISPLWLLVDTLRLSEVNSIADVALMVMTALSFLASLAVLAAILATLTVGIKIGIQRLYDRLFPKAD